METCLVLYARAYDFKSAGGDQVTGCSVVYLTGDVENTANARGCQPLTVTAPASMAAQFEELPGYYDMDFKQRPGPKGKPTLQLSSVKFVQRWEALNGVPEQEKAA